jgi:glutathione peroxidase
MKRASILVLACVALALAGAAQAAEAPTSPLGFKVKDISGKEVDLAKKYEGKVCLIVNVASKCGLTEKNYAQLNELHAKYKEKGLAILAFPANNFGGQEPGSEAEIAEFCAKKKVEFDLYSKVSVKGDDQAEIYKFLTSEKTNKEFAGDIEWNFTKFLVGKDGKLAARFGPKVDPKDPKLVKALDDAIAAEGEDDEWDDLDVGNLSGQAVL